MVGAAWDPIFVQLQDHQRSHWPGVGDDWPVGDYYHHLPTGPRLPTRTRPWQIGPQGNIRQRVASMHHRMEFQRRDPSGNQVVVLRCLVCLGEKTDLRPDQVCGACDKDWRRKGRPWGHDYEDWVDHRRVTQFKERNDHIAAILSARFREFVQADPEPSHTISAGQWVMKAVTSENIEAIRYNGYVALTPQHHSPEDNMQQVVEVKITGAPDQVAAAIQSLAGHHQVETARLLDEQLADIIPMRRPRTA